MGSIYEISKEFEFDFGHRVWSQQLDQDLSDNSQNACRHLHGHRGKIVVYLGADSLDERGMVVDFNNLNWFKKWIDNNIDHKFLFDKHDPLLIKLLNIHFDKNVFTKFDDFVSSGILQQTPSEFYSFSKSALNHIEDPSLVEFYESLVILPFVPTSENISFWLYYVIESNLLKMNLINYSLPGRDRIKLLKVEFYETPKSKSCYNLLTPIY